MPARGSAAPQTRFCKAMERAKTSRPQPKSAETGCTNRPKPARTPKDSSSTIEPQASTSIGLRQKLGGETREAGGAAGALEIGRAHVRTPVTNAPLLCRLLPDKKNKANE